MSTASQPVATANPAELCALNKDALKVINVIFAQRLHGHCSSTHDLRKIFTDWKTSRLVALLIRALRAGALERDEDQEWRVTQSGLEALRSSYKNWTSVFSEEDERKAMA